MLQEFDKQDKCNLIEVIASCKGIALHDAFVAPEDGCALAVAVNNKYCVGSS